jgi:molybdopterin-containing oxidoreductase family membrane subunit
MITCNCILINLLWFPAFRKNVYLLWVLCIFINIGMWLERFVIIVTSLSNDFLPSSWGTFRPTMWDISTYIGSIGLFLTLLFLFVRVLPVIAVSELRELVHHKSHHGHSGQTPAGGEAR